LPRTKYTKPYHSCFISGDGLHRTVFLGQVSKKERGVWIVLGGGGGESLPHKNKKGLNRGVQAGKGKKESGSLEKSSSWGGGNGSPKNNGFCGGEEGSAVVQEKLNSL